MNRQRGFTLIELIITVAIVAIVLAIGVPSFQGMIRDNRLATQVNELVTAMNLARSEAIKRGRRVTLCKSADGANCATSGGYQQGWIVFVDPNDNAVVDVGEQVLRVKAAMEGNLTLTGNSTVQSYISYVAGGMSQLVTGGFQAGTLTLCATPKARSIIINSLGRARLAETSC
ncbi:GspH/FimT family pseudopilin [Candidatus Contendibacter odensensis]|uniref:Type II secretion system protein H n=1 Tax=Candidatus Contendobacter odensis Run_B_J11 TaxID=1400861 RepID=A0A7U7J3D2_9GAMM|nr:Tfp pilus assembly protein FimT/FimU [Candidatus Contendobacter odensis]CDH45104.1 putative type-4 fimbrial pilin related signal peptide protein [Candidatus Contendobacter odensis Run_B_J11]